MVGVPFASDAMDITLVILGTDLIMDLRRTTEARAPLQLRLAIGRITLAVLVITWAAPITSGSRDIG